jgi:peroxiredoxin
LRGIEKNLPEFESQGIRPVAISVDPPEVSEKLASKKGYTFTLLCDPKAEVIRRYELLHPAAGPDGKDISRPAEFLVDRSGTVRWVNFTEDIRVRPKAQQLLAAARAIQ